MNAATSIEDLPDELARDLATAPRPLLLGLDIDGVLAPIVEHAEAAALTPGVLGAISDLASLTPVAIISGRDLASIERRFDFPETVPIVGSHGLERRGQPIQLDDAERDRLSAIVALAEDGAKRAGEGAWAEQKPAGAALHVRRADPGRGLEALTWFEHAVDRVDGTTGKAGHHVYEAMVRRASKAAAMAALRAETDAATAAFVGDDVTDEDVFRSFGPDDFPIRVGPGHTAARYRLADPDAVVDLLRLLVTCLADGGGTPSSQQRQR